jgi:hypothetical protein
LYDKSFNSGFLSRAGIIATASAKIRRVIGMTSNRTNRIISITQLTTRNENLAPPSISVAEELNLEGSNAGNGKVILRIIKAIRREAITSNAFIRLALIRILENIKKRNEHIQEIKQKPYKKAKRMTFKSTFIS